MDTSRSKEKRIDIKGLPAELKTGPFVPSKPVYIGGNTTIPLYFDVRLQNEDRGWAEVMVYTCPISGLPYPICTVTSPDLHNNDSRKNSLGMTVLPVVYRFTKTGLYRIVVKDIEEDYLILHVRVSSKMQEGSRIFASGSSILASVS